jgi:hypothetical protein
MNQQQPQLKNHHPHYLKYNIYHYLLIIAVIATITTNQTLLPIQEVIVYHINPTYSALLLYLNKSNKIKKIA